MRAILLLVLLIVVGTTATFPVGGTVALGDLDCDGGYCETAEPRDLVCTADGCQGWGNQIHHATIVDPMFDDGAWLEAADLVLGTVVQGVARAYPISILSEFRVVADTLGDERIVVTYGPLGGVGTAFAAHSAGQGLDLRDSGYTWQDTLVLYDLQTSTLWSQLSGEGISGELAGERLVSYPVMQVQWDAWQIAYPETTVMAKPTDLTGRPVSDFATPVSTRNDRVHVIAISGEELVIPLRLIPEGTLGHVTHVDTLLVAVRAGGDIQVFVAGEQSYSINATDLVSGEDRYDPFTGASKTSGADLILVAGITMYNSVALDFYTTAASYVGDEGGFSLPDEGGSAWIPWVLGMVGVGFLVTAIMVALFVRSH